MKRCPGQGERLPWRIRTGWAKFPLRPSRARRAAARCRSRSSMRKLMRFRVRQDSVASRRAYRSASLNITRTATAVRHYPKLDSRFSCPFEEGLCHRACRVFTAVHDRPLSPCMTGLFENAIQPIQRNIKLSSERTKAGVVRRSKFLCWCTAPGRRALIRAGPRAEPEQVLAARLRPIPDGKDAMHAAIRTAINSDGYLCLFGSHRRPPTSSIWRSKSAGSS